MSQIQILPAGADISHCCTGHRAHFAHLLKQSRDTVFKLSLLLLRINKTGFCIVSVN